VIRYYKLSIHEEMIGEDFDNVFNEFGGKILASAICGSAWEGNIGLLETCTIFTLF
jgi:hypothetical protein